LGQIDEGSLDPLGQIDESSLFVSGFE
jgi:hypothetical protein